MEKKWVLLEYLKEKRKVSELLFILLAIWGVFSYLNHESFADSAYLLAIWFFVVILYGVCDYLRYRKLYLTLELLQDEIRVSVEHLPVPNSIIEEKYQELLKVVHRDKVEQLTKMDLTKADMLEYFTLWVHQVKTPIAGMSLLLQMSEGEEKEELKGELFRIEQYVDMVLNYLRMSFDNSDFVLQAYDVGTVVKKAVHTFAGQFIRKKLTFHMDGVSGKVITDEKWLQFVVEQLLSNAIKYTEKGGVTISFQENTLCIADTGIGIASEDLPRIFEKGYTGYNGRLDEKATGIGLYLCQQAMQKLGGSIWAESEVGMGTRFYLKLPEDDMLYE